MTVVQTTVEVEAPLERVWAVVSDPRNLPHWDRHIVAVTGVPPGGLEPGLKYTTDVRFMGVSSRISATVLELQPKRFAKIRLTGLMDGIVETTVEGMGNGRTRLTQKVDYRFAGGPIGLFAAEAVRNLGAGAVLKRGVMAQKREAEAAVGA